MNKRADKTQQSEFEQKLNESILANQRNASSDSDYTETAPAPAADASETVPSDTIPVIEEQLKVKKQVVETGTVHVSKSVHEDNVTVNVPTVHEEVDVERVEINEFVETTPPPVRYEGDKMIIPVLREVSVVVKKIQLVEEWHITKRKVETHEPQQVTLRKEEVNINRVDSNNNPDQV
ncbi:YsnF/AvaK domain-containing protein [Pontibacter silvestris]|uniref:YsnF/AvaK domain-containing protein n=1 Tax=Pontibacter silvestris TaxID=2305183 RepID=A0ABW4WTG4_9BACT|nr:YsnF/AvaK domain-containing protein [Pontibacter silvestris]MCC9138014.1 YsnF/AvaK domain-containing protein [Pontibacter silvestris]